jgi:hypothetical protein
VGNVESLQGDALPIEAGDQCAGVAQASLIGFFGYDKDTLGELPAQLHLPVIYTRTNKNGAGIRDVEQGMVDGCPGIGWRAIAGQVAAAGGDVIGSKRSE